MKHVENFLFGLCFGMGFCCAVAVLRFVVGLLAQGAGGPNLLR